MNVLQVIAILLLAFLFAVAIAPGAVADAASSPSGGARYGQSRGAAPERPERSADHADACHAQETVPIDASQIRSPSAHMGRNAQTTRRRSA